MRDDGPYRMDSLPRLAVFFLGITVGIALSLAWFFGAPSQFDSTTLTSSTTPKMATTTPSGAVSVSDQVAGDSVSITSVTVPPPGVWVSVRDLNGDSLGNVLGAVRVHGPVSNVVVPLLRPTVAGRTYAVQLYRDDGDSQFDHNVDSVYVDFDTGQPVTVLFKALP